MKRDEVIALYDDQYAHSYEEKFLLSPLARSDTEHELQLLKGLLAGGQNWLDVACGTGYFLRHFPEVARAGCDLSPAMLRLARQVNPGVSLVEHDFREANPAWNDRWGLVSCMYYAYSLVDTVRDLLRVIDNLAAWTAPGGTCYVPLSDPRLIAGVNLPYHAPSPFPGQVRITGILWDYVEDDGRKIHSQLIAPTVEFMVEHFATYFAQISITEYPPAAPGWPGRPALVATHKKIGADHAQ